MIRLCRTTERAELVYTGDCDVTGGEADVWVARSSVSAGPGALVAVVRGLSHTELVRCLSAGGTAEAAIAATDAGTLELRGEGLPSRVSDGLPMLPTVERVRLGMAIIGLSEVPQDPTSPTGSA